MVGRFFCLRSHPTVYENQIYPLGIKIYSEVKFLLTFVNTYIFGPGLCAAVFGAGLIFLIYLRGFFIIKPCRIAAALKNGGGEGISPLKAMIVALAGTLGVGNIVGVASAVYMGGAGAVFWMLLGTLAAIPIKYAETALSVGHRRKDGAGKPHGGAWFYMSDKGSQLMRAVSAVFAVLCLGASVTMGCMTQANAISVSALDTFGVSPLAIGLCLALLVLATVSGGLNRISFVTYKLIPAAGGLYVMMTLFIILTNTHMLGDIVKDIMTDAFSGEAIGGGVMGFLTSRGVRIGVTRSIVSNEAGCGTAPIAHASADRATPAAQGVWGMAEVFIDTAVMCTLTALCVLIGERHGIAMVSDGMITVNSVFGRFIPFAGPIISAAICIFAFCTMVCWFFYGTEALGYLTGSKRIHTLYLAVYSICALVGSVSGSTLVWGLSDLTVSMMTALNIAVLITYAKDIKKETDIYFFGGECKKRNKDTVKSK